MTSRARHFTLDSTALAESHETPSPVPLSARLGKAVMQMRFLVGLLLFESVASLCDRPARDAGCGASGKRVALIQLASAHSSWSSSHAQAINLFYARLHSYDYISYSCPSNTTASYSWDAVDQSRSNWCKPQLLIRHLPFYDLVAYIDSDAYFVDPEISIEGIAD